MVFGFGKRESKAMSKLPAAPPARERAQSAFIPEDRKSVFPSSMAKGGQEILDPKKTAILFIEFQNEVPWLPLRARSRRGEAVR